MYEAEDDHDLVQDPLQLLLRRLFVPCSQLGVDIFSCMETQEWKHDQILEPFNPESLVANH